MQQIDAAKDMIFVMTEYLQRMNVVRIYINMSTAMERVMTLQAAVHTMHVNVTANLLSVSVKVLTNGDTGDIVYGQEIVEEIMLFINIIMVFLLRSVYIKY